VGDILIVLFRKTKWWHYEALRNVISPQLLVTEMCFWQLDRTTYLRNISCRNDKPPHTNQVVASCSP